MMISAWDSEEVRTGGRQLSPVTSYRNARIGALLRRPPLHFDLHGLGLFVF